MYHVSTSNVNHDISQMANMIFLLTFYLQDNERVFFNPFVKQEVLA